MTTRRRIIIFIITIIVLAHFVFTSSRVPGVELPLTDKLVMKLYSPILRGLSKVKHATSHFLDDYFFLVGSSRQNRTLSATVEHLLIENQSLQTQLNIQNEQKQAIEQYKYLDQKILSVNQIAFDPLLSSKTMIIDAGAIKGVSLNGVVVSGHGLVGRVIEVFDKSSKVLLVIDPYFSVDTVNQRSGLRALVQGLLQNQLEARSLPFLSQVTYFEKGHDMQKGDVLVTSGLGGMYPKGIAVGEVVALAATSSEALAKGVVVRPSVDFTKMAAVFVLVK